MGKRYGRARAVVEERNAAFVEKMLGRVQVLPNPDKAEKNGGGSFAIIESRRMALSSRG